jgi:hypothetical protein
VDDPNVVIVPKGKLRAELFVWLPGSNGHPKEDGGIETTAAEGGYRVIALQYNNRGTVENLCRKSDDAECLTHLRDERAFGGVGSAVLQNTMDESVEVRLTRLLKYLAAKYPSEGWTQYLNGDAPAWDKIVLAGHSQGAAMTAFIAKNREVARAVLFSGGADGVGTTAQTRKWSSWLTMASKTPSDRWYAEYNVQEAIAAAEPFNYVSQLKIPEAHVLKFTLDLPPSQKMGKPLEAHMSVVHDPRYKPEWQWMIGTSDTKPAM